jgi:spore maturation protein CgeB
MKILIVGKWIWPQYEASFAKSLISYGHEVEALSTENVFSKSLFGRFQNYFPFFLGPKILTLNWKIWLEIINNKYDLVLFWRPTHILPLLILGIVKKGIQTVSYNNDDPFGPRIHKKVQIPFNHHFLWFWYLRSLKYFNYNFFYRKVNCVEARLFGAKHTDVLLPYFLPWKNQPIKLSQSDFIRFDCDIVFVGHFESDNRLESVRRLVQNGFKVKIWGDSSWSNKVGVDILQKINHIEPAVGIDYEKALCGAKICLVFLSKLNRDTYTRRCFEIPACGCLMLAERTDDLMDLFIEDKEACFFSSDDELIIKARWLLANPDTRRSIAYAGFQRVWSDGHDVDSRVNQFLNQVGCNSVDSNVK